MQRIANFLKGYHRTRSMVLTVLIAAAATVVLFLVFYRSHSTLRPMDPAGLSAADESYLFAIEEAAPYEEDYWKLSGWALRKGEDILVADAHFILRAETTGVCYRLPTAIVERADVDAVVDEEGRFDYELCGIESVVRRSQLSDRYRILIAYRTNGDDVLLDTGVDCTQEGVVLHE